VFSFGVNDTTLENGKTRVELSNSIENCREILSAAKQLFPVLVGPPPIADSGQNLRIAHLSGGRLMCAGTGCALLRYFYPLQESAIWMSGRQRDGSHRLSWLCRIALGTKLVCLLGSIVLFLGAVQSVMFYKEGGPLCTWMKTAWIRN